MSRWLLCGSLALALLVSSAPRVDAQSTASVSGVVRDTAGGVVPGVTVVVKDEATGNIFQAVTGSDGRYNVQALQAGTYTVSAALQGFKTAEAKGVRVSIGQPLSINLTLEVGKLEETVTVTGVAELVNTQTATVAATFNSDQLTRLPTPTRNALNAVAFLPGINTPGTNRDSTILGLPETFVSITLDGVSNNDNFLRSTDSFFASVTPRQDAVEAVSVTLAAAGAQVGAGAGAVTMAFQTRSGTNRFAGSGYEYYRTPDFNSNYYFNAVNHQGKNQVKLNQFGGRLGGPIVKNKAFFFFHYEQIRFPNTFTRTRTVFNSRVYDGWFRYQYGTGANAQIREVNLLQLAAANGQISTPDPTMAHIMSMINSATQTTGTRTASADPLYDTYVWQSPSELFEHQPTMRLDWNVTNNHRVSGSYTWITAKRTPDYLNSADPRFPGAPNQRDFVSTRPLVSMSLRSVLSPNTVNEVRGGMTAFYGGSHFGQPSAVASRNGPSTFEDQGGFAIRTPTDTTDWYTSNGPSWRSAPTYSLDDSFTWMKNRHTINMGGNILISNADSDSQQMVRGITLGFNTDYDPAIGMFNTTNFPGASNANLDAARATYAVLTGRVSSVNSQAVLDSSGHYVELGPQQILGGIKVYGLFAQDSWKPTPNLTLTGGLRWEVQTPFTPSTSVLSSTTMASICGQSGLGDGGMYSRCNFLHPGSTGGATPEFIQLQAGTEGYKTDWNNIAPSASVAWRPNVQKGFLRAILGDPEQATFRGGYSVGYDRQGLTIFTGWYGSNPGTSISLTRNANLGLVNPGESWPVLLSQTSRLYPATFVDTPTYPINIRANRADSLYAFAPDIQIGRVRNWMIGWARSVSKDMAVEIRYVANHADNVWSNLNYNSIRMENILANGFLDEFRLAMANLTANNASGISSRSGSFAYYGAGTNTYPLPIYLAYLTGSRDYNNPAAYTGGTQTFRNSSLAGRLVAPNPNPTSSAGDLDGNLARRTNGLNAGYPANFFVLNPQVNGANVYDSGAQTEYGAVQIELRRRWSHGVSGSINYQYVIKEKDSAFDGFSFGRAMVDSGGDPKHAIKLQWDWSLPFGRGERFASNAHPIVNGIIGGWSINGVGRFQRLLMNFGNVRLVNMTADELQAMYQFRFVDNPTTGIREVWMLPEDVILNTRRAFSTVTTTTNGYSTSLGAPDPTSRYIAPANSADCIQIRPGDCAPRSVLVLAPWFKRVDVGATKRFNIRGSVNFEVRFDMLNVFNTPNFNVVANPGTSASIFRTTSAYTDASNTYDPGGRIGQLMFRINW